MQPPSDPTSRLGTMSSMTAEHHFNCASFPCPDLNDQSTLVTIPLALAWPQVDYGTNDEPEATGLHTIGSSRMQSYEFQPSFNDNIDLALYCSPSALMYQGAGHGGELGGENSGETQ